MPWREYFIFGDKVQIIRLPQNLSFFYTLKDVWLSILFSYSDNKISSNHFQNIIKSSIFSASKANAISFSSDQRNCIKFTIVINLFNIVDPLSYTTAKLFLINWRTLPVLTCSSSTHVVPTYFYVPYAYVFQYTV